MQEVSIKQQNQELYEDIYKEHFSFWKNWQQFLEKLDEQKIENAKEYLLDFIGWKEKIEGKMVIDFWSWSGLMSLCFALLGAKVTSVDIDENSIACTMYLREKYNIPEENWKIKKGSVLDLDFIQSLGVFDIVYSWWVIHHSGDMWRWLQNIMNLLKPGGLLYIAIYNDNKRLLEGTSGFWKRAKRLYAGSSIVRPIMKSLYTIYLITGLAVFWKNPVRYIRDYSKNAFRGMDFFVDIEDWLGWYPYEYASYSEIIEFYKKNNCTFVKWLEVRSIGCNEFLFSYSI